MGISNVGSGVLSYQNVTRFGEISPKCRHFKSLWQLFDSSLNIWQNVEPSLEIFRYYLGTFSLLQMGQYGKFNVTIWLH